MSKMRYPTWNFKNYHKWRLFEEGYYPEEQCRYNYNNLKTEIKNFEHYANWLELNESRHSPRCFKFKEWLFSLKVDKLLK